MKQRYIKFKNLDLIIPTDYSKIDDQYIIPRRIQRGYRGRGGGDLIMSKQKRWLKRITVYGDLMSYRLKEVCVVIWDTISTRKDKG